MHSQSNKQAAGGVAWWKWLLLPLMGAVAVLSYLYAGPLPGFQSPETARIIFWHVPHAILSMVWFFTAAFYSFRYLRGGDLKDDLRAGKAAEIGLLLTVLATITGAVFSKMQWEGGLNTPWYYGYWTWDAKQTAILVVILIFSAYFGLRSSVDDPRRRARLAAAYALMGAVLVPVLYYTLPHLPVFQTQHPEGVIAKQRMSPEYRLVFWMSTLGFLGFSAWMYQLQVRLELAVERLQLRSQSPGSEARIEAVRRPVTEP